jgi:hypothetical protein
VEEQADLEYRRTDTAIQIVEEFERRKEACARAGGALQVSRSSSGRLPPTTGELRTAMCEKRSIR